MSVFATYVLEVNWNGDGSTFVDETAYMLSVEWKRGKDYSSALTGRIQVGTLKARLNNNTGRFSPFNASSPIYGNILPSRLVRLRTTAPTVATCWTGYLDTVIPDPGARDTGSRATLNASGPLRYVGDRESNTALYTSILAGAAIGHVLDDAGWPAGLRTLDVGQVTMLRWKADTSSEINTAVSDAKLAMRHLQEIEESELGMVGESRDGKIVFEDAHHRHLAPHTASQGTFSDGSGADTPYELIEEQDPWKLIYNRFVADVVPYQVTASSSLWSLSGETPAIGPGMSRTFWAVYPPPGSSTAADHVDSWGTAVVTANTKSDGSGVDMTALITVVATPTANTDQLVLTNTDPSRVAFITALTAYGAAVQAIGPTRVVSQDAASQTAYGKRTYPLGGKFYPTSDRAQNFTDFGLSRFKDLQPILALSFCANDLATLMTQALTRDISDRITVVASGTIASGAGLGISADFFIESEHHSYDLEKHMVTYLLSFAGDATHAGDGGYWTLGVSALNQTTKLDV